MKVRQVTHYIRSDDVIIIVVDEDENVSCLAKIEATIVATFSAIKTDELVGLDQIYIDLKIEDNLLIIAWDSMAGISIECENPELRERIFKHLQKI
ncbi:hypothetical protein H6F78_13565 [Coleofasciculus sp. FACHB-64]|uniref:hypothetical protein n=1 Tax=Cyanophyceae TaxID=3028117 RepID=UPI001685C4CE|nr:MULTISPECIES: hypothetical protein [unclassified Coleofasciculus]MBD1877883.1 hypothetical protein [Coleofasciculus sp. FACHB-T130]MBD2046606.1 hypothetical protein [Coleofasciculus sp. FACHB-64]MBD2541678.1 hypothetical protein [Coleofasciculus sp. FACHB-SPT36]